MHRGHLSRSVVCALLALAACSEQPPTPAPARTAPATMPDVPGASAQWQTTIAQRIAGAQYKLRADSGKLRSVNHANGLTAQWSASGLRLHSRPELAHVDPQLNGATLAAVSRASAQPGASVQPDANVQLELHTVAIERAGKRIAARPASYGLGACRKDNALDELGACLERAEDTQSAWVEWWENRPDGLEQGFDLAQPPLADAGARPLRIEVAIAGANVRLADDGQSALLESATGATMRYGQLHAYDADRHSLPISLVPFARGVAIEVDDAGAKYPIAVDPLVYSASWTGEQNDQDSEYGRSVASAGDVNGDGYGDVIVGAPRFDWSTNGAEGQVWLYLGSATGLKPDASWSAHGDKPSSGFGYSVASAGDYNGDGFGDIVVGAPLYDDPEQDEGAIFVFYGKKAAPFLDDLPRWKQEYNQASGRLGLSVASAGDVNNDGFGDIIAGCPFCAHGEPSEGLAFVYLGIKGTTAPLGPTTTLEENAPSSTFGWSVASAGDVNGDGKSDVIVGAPAYASVQSLAFEGEAFVYYGNGTSSNGTAVDSAHAWSTRGNQSFAVLGRSVASAGDVDGNGYGDVIVGMPGWDASTTTLDVGKAQVFGGGPNGLSATPIWQPSMSQAGADFGSAVASAGDINADGYGDVIIGADTEDSPGFTDDGSARVYTGGPNGLTTVAAWTGAGAQGTSGYGQSVASAGDVNGDGRSDVIVGALAYDAGSTNEGKAFLYQGSSIGLASSTAAWDRGLDQANAMCSSFLGLYCFGVAGAGDVDGNGYSDVLVTAQNYTNDKTSEGRAYLYMGGKNGPATSASWTVESDQDGATIAVAASAGDVNGDGFGDVLVTSPLFHNPQPNEGRLRLYLGGATGLALTHVWEREGNIAGAAFGMSAATAGDVDGDGFGDIIVGSPYYGTTALPQRGRISVFYGAATGIPTRSWIKDGNEANLLMGIGVASAGDVNADGYDDVIVGVPLYGHDQSAEGQARIYLGGASGLAASYAWSDERNIAGANFGYSVASAGDVDGDGYSDVIVGAPGDSGAGPSTNRGAVHVFYGGYFDGTQTTVSPDPDFTMVGGTDGDSYGVAVSSAGDLNSDGYADIIFGAPGFANQAGVVFALYGGANGIANQPALLATSNQTGSLFGRSVASAGDVNGDGFGDVLVAAPSYNVTAQNHEGRAYLYLGNSADGSKGLPLLPQARRPNLTTPVVAGGKSMSASGFDASMLLARGPMGRTRVKLQVESKRLGVPFDGVTADLSTGAWTDVTVAGKTIKRLIAAKTGTGGSALHWRARLLYDLSRGPWFQRSRWLYGGTQGQSTAVQVRIAP